ncbi:MAG TPA: restriction endonuclease, SacI family [Anaerolineales bacterium]|nr:restriction endonuclease, SacI family [Anaerolineales bacterium]
MAVINYNQARDLLNDAFLTAEFLLISKHDPPNLDETLQNHFNIIFASKTQAYREVFLGCLVARILDRTIDVHLPYVSHGPNAFNARELDERVINPFLQSRHIPSTKGPYLSTFRRQVKFVPSTREGLRDKRGYDSLLSLIDHLAAIGEEDELRAILVYILFRFAQLREASNIPITRIQRFSLDQYSLLFSSLLSKPSGGLYPVLLAVCMFETIKQYFNLDWEIKWQGINVSDAASGAGGDITIIDGNKVLLAIEVTERVIDKSRLVSTFNTKIAPAAIKDYLFLVGGAKASEEARNQAQRYFAQGHEINFIQIRDWLILLLATLGKSGRDLFNINLIRLLDAPDVPQLVKVAWNESVEGLFG